MYTVLITGGSRGIGKAIADKYRATGYTVIAPTSNELNLADEKSVSDFISNNKDLKIDILINNAGRNDINSICDITDNEIETMFRINLISPIKLIRGVADNMICNKFGRIINIGSVWAVVSKAGRCVYSATKNGIHGVTNTLAVELAPYNILVNTVCPGFTMTEMTYKNNTAEQINILESEIPLGRMAKPKEIAEIVCFLGSEKNTYLTGQKIVVDGGYTAK